MKNVLTPLAKNVLIPLGLRAAVSATDAAIQNKIYRSDMTTLKVSKKLIKYIMEIVKYFKESGLLNKGVSKTIENKVKEQKATLGANLLANMVAGNDKKPGQVVIIAGKGTNRTRQDF